MLKVEGRTRNIRSILIALLVLAAAPTGYLFYVAKDCLADSYALLHTADLIIEYLKTHDDQWPRSWAELKAVQPANSDYLETFKPETGGYPDFVEHLERRVVIDFTVQTSDLLQVEPGENTPALRVICLRKGRKGAHYGNVEPNSLI
jgi:hypothetical protein